MTARVVVAHHDVFASRPGGGNPCPVVVDAGDLTAARMQSIAAHFGHESGFARREDDGSWRYRFFVPRHEMSMCVHATIAATTLLLSQGQLHGRSTVVRTASGDCQVSWSDGRAPEVTVEQQTPEFGPELDIGDDLLRALSLPPGALDPARPVRAVSVSRAKLIVPLRRPALVHGARPESAALWQLCREAGTTGAYVVAADPARGPGRVVARQFPVDAGYPEDPATGVAAGALAAYLAALDGRPGRSEVQIEQGAAMGRPSRLLAAAFTDAAGRPTRTTVTGRADHRRSEVLELH